MTNNLRQRVWRHKNHPFEGCTDDYNFTPSFAGRVLMMWQTQSIERNNLSAGAARG